MIEEAIEDEKVLKIQIRLMCHKQELFQLNMMKKHIYWIATFCYFKLTG